MVIIIVKSRVSVAEAIVVAVIIIKAIPDMSHVIILLVIFVFVRSITKIAFILSLVTLRISQLFLDSLIVSQFFNFVS